MSRSTRKSRSKSGKPGAKRDPEQDQGAAVEPVAGFPGIFQSAKSTALFCATGLFLVAVVAGAIYGLVHYAGLNELSTDGLKVDSTRLGDIEPKGDAIQLQVGGDYLSVVSVAANQLWVDTRVVVEPGETWEITATGSAHLAIHHLVEAGELDWPPRTNWVPPHGEEYHGGDRSSLQVKRDSLRLATDAGYGCLLVAAVPEGATEEYPTLKPRLRSSGAGWIKAYKSGGLKISGDSERLHLFLCVNDQYLDRREMYVCEPVDHLRDLTRQLKAERTPNYEWATRSVDRLVEHYPDEWMALTIKFPKVADITAPEKSLLARQAALSKLSVERQADVWHWISSYQWDLAKVVASDEIRARMFFSDNVGSYIVRLFKRAESDSK